MLALEAVALQAQGKAAAAPTLQLAEMEAYARAEGGAKGRDGAIYVCEWRLACNYYWKE